VKYDTHCYTVLRLASPAEALLNKFLFCVFDSLGEFYSSLHVLLIATCKKIRANRSILLNTNSGFPIHIPSHAQRCVTAISSSWGPRLQLLCVQVTAINGQYLSNNDPNAQSTLGQF